jgi:hypothetical protein
VAVAATGTGLVVPMMGFSLHQAPITLAYSTFGSTGYSSSLMTRKTACLRVRANSHTVLPPLPRSLTCSKMREADGTAAASRPGYQGKREAKARVSASDGESDHLHV